MTAMVTVAAPARPHPASAPTAPPLPGFTPPQVTRRARPIPVAAYPAGVPRWVTYDGRRRRVVAVHELPAPDPALPPTARRMQVELAGGHLLTLLHDRGGWQHVGGAAARDA